VWKIQNCGGSIFLWDYALLAAILNFPHPTPCQDSLKSSASGCYDAVVASIGKIALIDHHVSSPELNSPAR
jgi:hypothetical protein